MVMQFICAPDSFKESLSAKEAAEAMGRGIKQVLPDAKVDLCPIADGGEGTVDALVAATDGTIQLSTVTGPLGAPVEAKWGLLGTGGSDARQTPTAVIEMAAASGMELLAPAQRNPMQTTTYGTGELIGLALDAKVAKIILGIGGSATNDGGCGAAQALGVKFFDKQGRRIDTPMCGGMLEDLGRIDSAGLDRRLKQVELAVACDVNNPLTGPNGAAAIFGPQKGATPAMVEQLDRGLGHLADLMQQQPGCASLAHLPGAGAAGGLGWGAISFLGGKLGRGIELVLEACAFARRVSGCDLCLTGEGRIDGQSLSGKAVMGVAAVAAQQGVSTVALVGAAGPGADRALAAGLAAIHEIGQGLSTEQSMARAAELLETKTAQVVGQWSATKGVQ